jgi:hypothetical protein
MGKLSADDLLALAHHEAGHAFVAHVHGRPFAAITLRRYNNRETNTAYTAAVLYCLEENVNGRRNEAYAVIAYGGPIAERKLRAAKQLPPDPTSAAYDWNTIERLAKGRPNADETIDTFKRRAENRAETIMAHPEVERAVEGIAAGLNKHKFLVVQDVQTILGRLSGELPTAPQRWLERVVGLKPLL